MVNQSLLKFEDAWEIVKREPTVWEFIEIKNDSFYYKINQEELFLSSFKSKDLPSSPYTLTFLGEVLTKLSPLANIMSRRPGTEEVTFYVLLNTPQSGIFGKKVDKKMLEVAAPPLVWRRKQIQEGIRQKIKEYIEKNESFYFLDIGSGAGFDSLEIERLIHRINKLTNNCFNKPYESLNIDIDSKWLKNNQLLAEKLFGSNHFITRENISIFDFLEKYPKVTLGQYNHLIISCNGFAEFLSDIELRNLYEKIFLFTQTFDGNVDIILPFANKNKKQESLGHKIGFKFKAKEKQELISMIKEIFKNYKVTYCEKHSHIVMNVQKDSD
ncbi:hypothetical protein PF023_02815 [Enterococcus thailandicus]|uniref:hypothetical protein n=1 Tax=Enterococcus thailandicus TaxID=417368 RepID=UPI0022EBE12A|nr:hypothetical protein [Enterococcus thailandicus]MDA3972967.1 hypothetical protein [Enterococcus thailandicus]MDA3975599.1 hypothetical protein [Enterococcus thailandicus]MDA3980427.1 hypothetical protein [Enterococcus thailandicus]